MENFGAIVGGIMLIIAILIMTRSGRIALRLFNIQLGVLMFRLGMCTVMVVAIAAAWAEFIAPHIPGK